MLLFFFSSRRRHTRWTGDWSSDVCSSDLWTSPDFATAADYSGKLVTRTFKTLKEYQDATKQDQHSVLVDHSIFVKASPPDKNNPQRLYNPEVFDLRLKPRAQVVNVEAQVATLGASAAPPPFPGSAIDTGVLLPTINDDFTGKAPDLGAYELDRPIPHYGPREWPSGPSDPNAPRSVTGPPH